MSDEFFEEQLPASKIKSQIVSSYFKKWAQVMLIHSRKIGYIDLFCGPGKYGDGSDSTPLLILNYAVAHNELPNSLVTIFNDNDSEKVQLLAEEINSIDGISRMKYKPALTCKTIGSEIIAELKAFDKIPSLVFLDPYGYKGLSLELIALTIKDWGCDCIFFFNYNRINMHLVNPVMKNNVIALFGEKTVEQLTKKIEGCNPAERERIILETFMDGLKAIKGQYSIKFKFYNKDGTKTSHFIILVTKHVLGYKFMKNIMAENCFSIDGIPTYEYSPARIRDEITSSLFGDEYTEMGHFQKMLSEDFKGKCLTVEEIFEGHNVGKPYTEKNYKSALLKMEMEGKVVCDPVKRRIINGKLTMGNKVKVTFK